MFTIVCLGDSITCEWEEPHYPKFWQELLDQKYGTGKTQVISAGVNGETAQDGYYRLSSDVLPHHSNLVTIMFGHNDLAYGLSPQQYVQDLELIIEDLKKAQVGHIWLLSPNQVWGKVNQARYPQFLRALDILSQTSYVNFIDLWHHAFTGQNLDEIYTYKLDYNGYSDRDWVHPNATGHHLIAQYLMNQFSLIDI